MINLCKASAAIGATLFVVAAGISPSVSPQGVLHLTASVAKAQNPVERDFRIRITSPAPNSEIGQGTLLSVAQATLPAGTARVEYSVQNFNIAGLAFLYLGEATGSFATTFAPPASAVLEMVLPFDAFALSQDSYVIVARAFSANGGLLGTGFTPVQIPGNLRAVNGSTTQGYPRGITIVNQTYIIGSSSYINPTTVGGGTRIVRDLRSVATSGTDRVQFGGPGSFVEFLVEAPQGAGTYDVSFAHVALTDSGAGLPLRVALNGTTVARRQSFVTASVPAISSTEASRYGATTLRLTLRQGFNRIRLTAILNGGPSIVAVAIARPE